jgi:antitoxin CptB
VNGLPVETAVDPVELNRLKWRCRRGLLENDLLIERFFARHGSCITPRQAEGLSTLMDLPDNDLLDLLLARTEPAGALDRPAVREVLAQLRPAARHGVVEYAQATRNPR